MEHLKKAATNWLLQSRSPFKIDIFFKKELKITLSDKSIFGRNPWSNHQQPTGLAISIPLLTGDLPPAKDPRRWWQVPLCARTGASGTETHDSNQNNPTSPLRHIFSPLRPCSSPPCKPRTRPASACGWRWRAPPTAAAAVPAALRRRPRRRRSQVCPAGKPPGGTAWHCKSEEVL